MKDDFTKATTYVRELKPVMIDTPFQGSSLVMTQDERYFVFGSREGRIAVADRETKQVILDRDLKQGSIWTLTLIENDKYILSAGASGVIKKFLFKDLSDVDEYRGHTDEINFIQVSADEKFMYTGSDDRSVREWDLQASPDTERSKLLYSHGRIVYAIDLSLDGTTIVSGSGDSTVKVYSLDSRTELATLKGHRSTVWAVKISSMKNVVVSGDQIGELFVWRYGTWEIEKKLFGHTDRIRYMDMARDESFVVTAGLDHTIKIWDMTKPRKEITLKGHVGWVKFAIIGKNQNQIYSISDDKRVASWRIPRFDRQLNFTHESRFEKIHGFGRSVYSKIGSGLEVYSEENAMKLRNIEFGSIQVLTYSFSATGDKVYVFAKVGSENKLLIWDTNSGQVLSDRVIDIDSMLSAIVFPNEEYVAVGQEIRIHIFKTSDMSKVHTFRSHKSGIYQMTVSPNNLRMFSADNQKKIKYYDTTKWEEMGGIELADNVKMMQVSACGDYLFVSFSNEVGIWAIKRMQRIQTIPNFTASRLIFSADQRSVFYNDGKSVVIRNMDTFEVVTKMIYTDSILDFTLNSDETLIITTNGSDSKIFSNPLKCDQITIFGDSNNTYDYIEYMNNVINSTVVHDPQYDTWLIEPFHINALHFYAYYNKPALLSTALACHSPFYPSRTRHTPLEIALDKHFNDSVEAIYKTLKSRLEAGDDRAFFYLGYSLIALNNSGFPNLHRIYELTMRKCTDTSLPPFIDESVTLPLVINSESPIVDTEEFGKEKFTEEGTAIVFAKSSFKISMNMGSQESTDLLESIIACSNEEIYYTKMVKMILKNKWDAVRWIFILQTTMYAVYLLLLGIYSTNYYGDAWFVVFPFSLSLLFFVYEMVQLYCNGMEYFEDAWNYIDLFRASMLFVYCGLLWGGAEGEGANQVYSLLVLSSWLRGITYFRVFGNTRYLIKLIMEATVDIISFFVILFYSTISFTLIYQALHKNDKPLSTQFADAFKMNLGDLDEGTQGLITWFLFIVVSIINPIIMLNLLISIMGDTFQRVKASKDVADARELAGMILEIEGIMGWRRSQNEMYFVKMVCTENDLFPEDDSLYAKIKTLKEKVTVMCGELASTKKEVIASIYEFRDRIINAI